MSVELPTRIKIKPLLKYVAELLGIAAIVFVVYTYQTRNLLPTEAQLAPALTAPTIDGSSISLHESGTPATLVYFFAPWCKVCAASSGNIDWLRKIRSDNELRILLVALDWQTIDEVRDYVEQHEISVPVLLGNSQVAHDWNIYAFPTYYMLDNRQRVIHRDLGYTTLAGLWWRSAMVN